MARRHSYAQTIIQLLNQLVAAGAGEQDLIRTQSSYLFATSVLGASMRPNGKPFVDHLVGTASILATHGQSQKLIQAGLLHAVYASGDFGNARTGIAGWKRQKVMSVAGKEVEELVESYTRFRWSTETLESLSRRIENLQQAEIETILIRLANELEECLDLGMFYCSKGWQLELVSGRHLEICKELAAAAGVPTLGAELERWVNLNEESELPGELRRIADRSYSVIPASYTLRSAIMARKRLGHVVRKVQSVAHLTSR